MNIVPIDPMKSIGLFRVRCDLCHALFLANTRLLIFCEGCGDVVPGLTTVLAARLLKR